MVAASARAQVVLPPYSGYTLRTVDLDSLPGDREPIALDVIDELVAPIGSSCPEGTRCVIRGFYSNSGQSSTNPGQFRHFEMLAPVPFGTSPLGITVGSPISNFNTNLAKKPGRQGVTATSTLAFCSIGERWTSSPAIAVPERIVSVVDSMTAAFDPVTGDKPTNLFSAQSGSMPQGGVSFTTRVDGVYSRFYAVANFRDGTITIYDWTNASNVTAVREFHVDRAPGACAGNGAAYGDLTRPIAAMKPTVGQYAGKTILVIGLNFDTYLEDCINNQDWDDSGFPDCSVVGMEPPFDFPGTFPDEGSADQLVFVDVSALTSANASTVTLPDETYSPIAFSSTQAARFGTITSVVPHPDGDVVYVLSYDNPGFNSCDDAEKPWIMTFDLASNTLFSTLFIPDMTGIAEFNATQGHMVLMRNEQLFSPVTDRLYIPAFREAGGAGRILILDITGTHKNFPAVYGLIEDPILDGLHVQDLTAVPITVAFLGSNLSRNVIFGVASDANNPSGLSKLFVLEDY